MRKSYEGKSANVGTWLATLAPTLVVPKETTNEQSMWYNFLKDQEHWIPICHPANHPHSAPKLSIQTPQASQNEQFGKATLGVEWLD
jgi:hypothetical protein